MNPHETHSCFVPDRTQIIWMHAQVQVQALACWTVELVTGSNPEVVIDNLTVMTGL